MEENNNFLAGKAQDTTLSPEQQQASITPKKKRTPKVKVDILPITPAAEVVVSEDIITQELAKHNITEALLLEMEANFMPLTIAGIDDKEGYEAVHKARIAVKNTRVLGVKLCKEGRAEAIKVQKGWIQAEDKFEARMKTMEDTLAARQKVIDDIKSAEKLERDTKEQVRLNERAVKLIALGMNFDGTAYILDDIKISVVQIKQLDEFVFATLLAGVETKFKEAQAVKEREAELKAIAEAEHKKLIEAQLAKEEELKLKEQAIAAREEAIRQAEAKAKADAEAAILKAQTDAKEKAEAEIAAREKEAAERLKSRRLALFQLGFSQQADVLSFSTLTVNESRLITWSEAEWSKAILNITTEAHSIKRQIDEERVQKESKIKADAIEAERKRAADEAYADAIANKEKEEGLAKEHARLNALKPDIDKLNAFCKAISDVPLPEFSTPAYQAFVEVIKADRLLILKNLYTKKPI